MYMIEFFRQNPNAVWIVLALLAWSLIWKGLALWRAARQADKPWFIALLILNTLGLLEIFYLLVFSRRGSRDIEVKP
jgi:methionyl-tRNA synthetase